MIGAGECWGWCWLAIGSVLLILFVYKKVRIKSPVLVNCWFCNKNTTVPIDSRNSWHCPNCEQYNGFDNDGGYNKTIEEQHVAHLNKRPLGVINLNKDLSTSNGLCKLCNLNQQLKIQQLAFFIPTKEENFDKEIKEYREQLEKSYHLCNRCEEILKETLDKQKSDLFANQNVEPMSKFSEEPSPRALSVLKTSAKSGLKIFSAIVAFWTASALISTPSARTTYFDSLLSSFFIPKNFGESQITQIFYGSHKFCKELTGVGFSSYLLSTSDHRSIVDVINLVLWGFFHALTWTNYVDLQLFISVVLLVSIFRASCNRRQYVFKKPPVKKSDDLFSQTTNPKTNKSAFDRPAKEASSNEKKMAEKDVKSVFDELGLGSKIGSRGSDPMQSRSEPSIEENLSTFFKKPFLSKTKDEFFGEKLSKPSEEIYSEMTHLSLGEKKEKVAKPTNFLFQNYNFKTKSNDQIFPLLKPSKLFKSDADNSLPIHETDEPFSEISTPSVCSGTKLERCGYPVSTPPFHQMNFLNNFHCFEGNPDHFCNDFNYRQHNFIPFSNGVNHVPPRVYSYPVRDDFPFSCKYVEEYPCFLNTRDSSKEFTYKNSFEKTGQKYWFTINWNSILSGFYATSVFFNFVTLFFFGYYLWSGLVSFDFRLPSFKFYV